MLGALWPMGLAYPAPILGGWPAPAVSIGPPHPGGSWPPSPVGAGGVPPQLAGAPGGRLVDGTPILAAPIYGATGIACFSSSLLRRFRHHATRHPHLERFHSCATELLFTSLILRLQVDVRSLRRLIALQLVLRHLDIGLALYLLSRRIDLRDLDAALALRLLRLCLDHVG